MIKLSILFKPCHGSRPRLQPFSLSGAVIMFFQMKFKFSKKIQTVYDFIQNLFFFNWIVLLF